MAKYLSVPTFIDSRGSLSVIDKILPFKIKRVYYIYNVNDSDRGYHSHKKTIQALIMINGSCDVYVGKTNKHIKYKIDSPSKCLLLNPEDFHWMSNFTENSVLLVLASEEFDKDDYIYEK